MHAFVSGPIRVHWLIAPTGVQSRVLGRLDGGAAWPQAYSFGLVRRCRVRVRVGRVRVGGVRVSRVRGGRVRGGLGLGFVE